MEVKKIALAILLAGSSATAMAANSESPSSWVMGIGYINLSDEGDILGRTESISLGGISGSLGYKFKAGNNFYLTPELRLGMGISDDSILSVIDVELDRFIALSLRGQFELGNGVYLFAVPSYANAKITVSAGNFGGETVDSWEFGIGGGAGYHFNETTSAEVMYESIDGSNLLNLGLKFGF